MSDTVRKVLFTSAGLMLTIAVITTYLFFYNRTKGVTSQVQQQTELQQHQIEEYAISRYHNSTIYGSQVISFLKNNENKFETIQLDSGSGNNDITGLQSFHDFNSVAYINVNAIYHLELEANGNGVFTKLQITLSSTP